MILNFSYNGVLNEPSVIVLVGLGHAPPIVAAVNEKVPVISVDEIEVIVKTPDVVHSPDSYKTAGLPVTTAILANGLLPTEVVG